MLSVSDFDFVLPEDLIAQQPATERVASRLLEVKPVAALRDWRFSDLPQLLQPGDVVVLNDSAVLKARLRARKESGGAVEILIERVIDERRALALVGTKRKLLPGQQLQVLGRSHLAPSADIVGAAAGGNDRLSSATVCGREDAFTLLEFDHPIAMLMEQAGTVPLPPYIRPDPSRNDEDRYRTVYQRTPGSVAAPTAGLHFDNHLLECLEAGGVRIARLTLHVGAGTFLPVRHEDPSCHTMHPEFFELGEDCAAEIARARANGGRVVAVGTTSLRTLESCADQERRGLVRSARGETRLFVRPGYGFRVCDALLTNFHLPRSTLLMLVSAFAGYSTIRDAYAHAVHHRYRFYSYGDACFLHGNTSQQ